MLRSRDPAHLDSVGSALQALPAMHESGDLALILAAIVIAIVCGLLTLIPSGVDELRKLAAGR